MAFKAILDFRVNVPIFSGLGFMSADINPQKFKWDYNPNFDFPVSVRFFRVSGLCPYFFGFRAKLNIG